MKERACQSVGKGSGCELAGETEEAESYVEFETLEQADLDAADLSARCSPLSLSLSPPTSQAPPQRSA